MSNLTFKTGQLGIPGLSNAERVSAPKQVETSKSFIKQNPYRNKWDTLGQLIGNSVKLATASFEAVTQYHRARELEISDKAKLSGAYMESFKNRVASGVTKLLSEETLEDNILAKKLQESPDDEQAVQALDPVNKAKRRLENFAAKHKEFEDIIASDKNLTDKMKADAMAYVDKVMTPLYESRTKTFDTEVKTKNIKELTKVAVNKVATEVGNKDVNLKEILSGNKHNIDAFKANGKDVDTFDLLNSAVDMYYDNKSVITSRYDEAKQYLEAGKDITPGFMKYMTKLTKYKNAIESKDLVISRKKAAEDKKRATYDLKNYSYTPANVNTAGIVEFGVTNGKHLNWDNLNSAHSIMVEDAVKQIAPLAIKAGKTEQEIKSLAEKQVKKYELAQFKNYLAKVGIHDYPISMYPSEFKSEAISALKSEVESDLANGYIASIEESYRFNPSVVKKTVQDNLRMDLTSIGSITDQNKFNDFRASIKDKYTLDNEILYSGLDNKTRVIYETLLGDDDIDIKEFRMRMQELDSIGSKYIKVPMDDKAKKVLDKLPVSIKGNVDDYFKHKYVAGSIGYVTEEDVNNFVNTHTIKTGIYGFRDSFFIDDGVIKSLGDDYSDKTKPLLVKYLKDKLPNISSVDGVTIEDYNGHTHIKKDGVNIVSIPTDKFKEEFHAIHSDEIMNTLNIKQEEVFQNKLENSWNKAVSENSTFSGSGTEGLGFGKEFYIDKTTGKKVYKKDYEKQLRQYEGGTSW